ncbi:winged helix-turn-helix transcriptional regulator [Candidatus Pristimantibacillus sp. PTI5]|uniref:winged helix-turn-helix transcriptional regulator n=1 Tax=Candidatus Pristimantibacillus sp. PTI5 TaxID=3400422 RepID=UPI003B02E463
MELEGLILQEVYHEILPKVEYSLSELGKSLFPVLLQLRDWGLHKKTMDSEVN